MVDIQSPTAEIRRGKKIKKERKIETTGQKYNVRIDLLRRAAIINHNISFLLMPSVLWHCWMGIRKTIRPVKKQVMRCLPVLLAWYQVTSGSVQ